jgi:hypothetical protein
MTAAAIPPARHRLRPARVFAYGSFAIMLAGWIGFAYALIATQQTLDDVWRWVIDLPLVLEIAAWIAGFPFLLGLAIWHASWDETLRLVLVGIVAAAYVVMFVPRAGQHTAEEVDVLAEVPRPEEVIAHP